MLDVPDIVLSSKLCRHNPTDSTTRYKWHTLTSRVSQHEKQLSSLLKSAKASSLFFNLYICVVGIGKL